ncbi:MAG: carbohydrate ABC transporter permease [Kiritimatiellaeota bacterium]|nr:carbohydrate ABC transporter permease [Kiritimatiellota bacterium]
MKSDPDRIPGGRAAAERTADTCALPGSRGRRIAAEAFLLFATLLALFPVVLIFLEAFKPDAEIVHFRGILPHRWTLENFLEVLGSPEEVPILRWFANSVFISSMVTLLVLVVDSLAAFALARLNLPGRRWMFAAIVATMMVPGQVLLVPVYLILNRLGWIDTPLALIVPAGAGAFGVFLLHQFFQSIPRELEDAAAIDGCSTLGIYWHVVLPLARPALATLGVFTFIGSWNAFLGPLVFMDSVDKYTLPVGVALFQTSYYAEYGYTLAASVICTLPVLVVFVLFSRQIIRGISLTGLKG